VATLPDNAAGISRENFALAIFRFAWLAAAVTIAERIGKSKTVMNAIISSADFLDCLE
jgi:hypothetical protein